MRLWKNLAEPKRPQITIWHMRFAIWIHKVTDTRSEYVITITFSLKQWLRECAFISALPLLLFYINIETFSHSHV